MKTRNLKNILALLLALMLLCSMLPAALAEGIGEAAPAVEGAETAEGDEPAEENAETAEGDEAAEENAVEPSQETEEESSTAESDASGASEEQAQEEAKPNWLVTLADTAKKNVGFLLVCFAVFAGLFLLARLFEQFLVKDRKKFSDTHYITYTAIFSTMAGVLMLLEFPLPFAPIFYKLDMSELPVMICTFYLGPVAGVVAELLKVFLNMLFKGGTNTLFIGEFANFAVGCTFVLPASVIYHAKPSKKTALLGMIIGTLAMTVFGSAFNALYLIPKYAQVLVPMEAIMSMSQEANSSITSVTTLVLYAVVPFNLIKGVLISVLTFLLYKRISPLMHKGDAKKISRSQSANAEKKS